MGRSGPLNAITDVPGLRVGNAEDARVRTGATVILPDEAAVAGVDVRGGGTGTREIELLRPDATVAAVNAVVLSGGSAFGLAAADGAMTWLAERRRGFAIAGSIVPIVPAAILFDLANGGDKDWGRESPYRDLGYTAAGNADRTFAVGNAGAGFGAKAGGLKGGLGTASTVLDGGASVGALAAVNSHGSVLMPGSGVFWSWPFERDGEFGGRRPTGSPAGPTSSPAGSPPTGLPGENTTLVVVATDCILTKAEATRLATMAQDGLARAIRPAHTPLDGDIVFALSTGKRPLASLSELGSEAADCVARAIARGVYAAEDLGSLRSYRGAYG